MDWVWALVLMLGMICAFMALGLPVAFAFLLANIAGALIYQGGSAAALIALVRGSWASISNINLAPIPLFLLMGEILLQTGVAFRAVDAVDRIISRMPGRLSVVAVSGGTVFSALSGSTIATTAMLGQALLPDMLKRGYHPTMAMGPIMAIGGVDMLIPPSALTVLLATLASGVSAVKISVADLLIAGILPGLLMASGFVAYIVLRCWRNPSLAPAYEVKRLSPRERWVPFLVYVVPLFLIFIVVMGSMFAGVASPTDAAALGCLATVLLAAAYRSLKLSALLACLKGTAVVTTMIFFIIAASTTFAQLLAYTGATDGALKALAALGLTKYAAIFCMIGVLLLLGCFMDQVSMMLLTLPFFMPLANELLGPSSFDHVWLGVILLIALQVGLLTPPFGLLLFVMKGVAPPSISIRQVWAAATPFTLIVMAVLLLIIFVPWMATVLPRMM